MMRCFTINITRVFLGCRMTVLFMLVTLPRNALYHVNHTNFVHYFLTKSDSLFFFFFFVSFSEHTGEAGRFLPINFHTHSLALNRKDRISINWN